MIIYSLSNSVSSVLSLIEIWAMRMLRAFKIKSLTDSFCYLPFLRYSIVFCLRAGTPLVMANYEEVCEICDWESSSWGIKARSSWPSLFSYSWFWVVGSSESKMFTLRLFWAFIRASSWDSFALTLLDIPFGFAGGILLTSLMAPDLSYLV